MKSNHNPGVELVSSIMEKIEEHRKQECQSRKIGLTTLYNEMLEDKKQPYLSDLHRQLDEAVADLYGFPKEDLDNKEKIISFLFDLNQKRALKQS